jgi:uracil-DNA glycosylase family 4
LGFGDRGIGGANLPLPAVETDSLERVQAEIISCFACPRLVAWREQVAREKRASFRDEEYWGRPVPSLGDPAAEVMVVGLAPAAHGGNRTGRVFTGDRSGDWVFRALHKAGYANQPTSIHRHDGLRLTGAYVAAAVRCAPPANKPTPEERDTCQPYLEREIALLPRLRVFVALGAFGYAALCRVLAVPRPRPRFAHGAEIELDDGRWIVCSYHPSQQNTFTGVLTEPMFDAVFTRARALAERGSVTGRAVPR